MREKNVKYLRKEKGRIAPIKFSEMKAKIRLLDHEKGVTSSMPIKTSSRTNRAKNIPEIMSPGILHRAETSHVPQS